MNKLNKFPLDQALSHNAMDSIVGGIDPNDQCEHARKRMAEDVRIWQQEQKREIELGKGVYMGGDDLIEYRKGNHTIGYTPHRMTYTKSMDCVILLFFVLVTHKGHIKGSYPLQGG